MKMTFQVNPEILTIKKTNRFATYKSNETGLIDYSYITAYTNKRTHPQVTTRIKSRF